ncbi:sensor histidine kinase [Cohnella sp. GCM10012308]|uniref:sensor histidine kinase n=1 Tax=Cohnella sp. GCM10012308 TaxID=3317329 RepID=UPI0036137506
MGTDRSRRWFGNQFIRNKIMAIYLPLILIPLLALGIASNRIYTQSLVDKTIKGVGDNSSLIITRINGILANAQSCANILAINLDRTILGQGAASGGDEPDISEAARILNQLSFSILVFPEVHSAAFIDLQGRVYATAPQLERGDEDLLHTAILTRIDGTSGENLWFPMERRTYLTPDPGQAVLTLGKRVFNINTGKPIGSIVLNVREETLSSVYRSIGSFGEGVFSIADDRGTVISSQRAEDLLLPEKDAALRSWIANASETTTIGSFDEGKLLVARSGFSFLDWQFIAAVPYEALTHDVRQVTMLIAVIGGICFLFALLGAGILNRLIAIPIVRMARSMKMVKEGNLDMRIGVRTNDELGLLASGFNTMIARIQDLLQHVKIEQRKKREYELALIQSQIKPHFLYNTLDVIYTLSQMDRSKDVQRTTKALADYYRIVLSKGSEQITLEEELSGLRDYLSIQKIRYSDVFDYQIDVDKSLLPCAMLKLTLQPLVENAIYHGLKTKGGFGHLSVRGRREGERMALTVEDNGTGMTEERIRASLGGAEDKRRPVSYGLRSVHERIKLYFGEAYGVRIESEPGRGTTITIILPCQLEPYGGSSYPDGGDNE